LRNITVLSQGDASSSKTWSNIPYFLVETLRQKGLKVNVVNVDVSGFGRVFFDRFFCPALRHTFLPDTTFSYDRTSFFQNKAKKIISSAVSSNPDTDVFISTSFSFLPDSIPGKHKVLLCDWTYEYLISHFKNRKSDCFEKSGIKLQDEVIRQADKVISLFPDVADYMSSYYGSDKVKYLGNVINSLRFELDNFQLQKRLISPHLVFVGLPKYIEGLKSLISSMELLCNLYPELQLDVIGMSEGDVPFSCPRNVLFHGYLEKSDASQLALYDSILKNAVAFINTTPNWAGFSSALEAMYYGLPIYTSRYKSFEETFGSKPDFGDYCENNTPEEIVSFVERILKMSPDSYLDMCLCSRKKAEPFTWSAYVDNLLSELDKL